ncbi:MAG: stage III sporulation protein AB [Clostridia bacterium]|nr:stage III sporulation protein AB [Clostridia bacterium]
MHFFKWLGVGLLLCCGVLGGLFFAAFEKRRVVQAEGFLRLLRAIRVQIDCFSLPVSQILASCDHALLRDVGACELPQSFPDLLKSTRLYLSPEICLLLLEFAGRLGTGYREEELRALDYYIARLAPYSEELRRELAKRERMAWLLPPALSVALVLLLL